MKPKLLLLLVSLHVHQTSSTVLVSKVNEAEVKSLVVKRRFINTDLFAINMKSNRRCIDVRNSIAAWCELYTASWNQVSANLDSCNCTCLTAFPTFIPSMQTCINKTLAASFAGCDAYFDGQHLLEEYPVNLGNDYENYKTVSVKNVNHCALKADYFDYNRFQSSWERISDGFFKLAKEQGTSVTIGWHGDATVAEKLSGRIIRLSVTCASFKKCLLLKALGPVTYYAPKDLLRSSILPSTQSQTTRLPSFTTGQILSTLTTESQSLMAFNSDDTTLTITSTVISHPFTSVVVKPIEPTKSTSTSSVSASSAGGGGGSPGDRGTQTSGNGNGVVIGSAVGGAVFLGIIVIVIIVFWKWRKTGKTIEKETKRVKNPVYGTSENDIQLESPNKSESPTMLSSAQDNQPTYQGLTIANGHSNGTAIYSSSEDEYDNCTVYQSLEKPRSGTPVYQSLKAGQAEPAHTTGIPNLKPKPRYTTLPNATGTPIAKGKTARGVPKPNPGAKGEPSQRSSLTPEPVYNVLDGPGSEQGTTPEPLYNVLEGPDIGQDYEATNVDPLYNALEGPNTTYDSAEIVLESNGAQNGPISGQSPDNGPFYNVLEGPESDQKSLEHGPGTAQEPLYNVLEGPDAEKSPLVDQGGPINDPLYNVLEGPDSGGSNQHAPNKPRPLSGRDNLAYEQTLEMDVTNAAVQRPGTQRESVYEALRGPTQDVYEALGQSGDPHSTC